MWLTSHWYLQIAVENAKGINVPGGKSRPSVFALSRQGMPNQPGTSIEGVAKGGYIVHGGDAKPDVILLSTGRIFPIALALNFDVMVIFQG